MIKIDKNVQMPERWVPGNPKYPFKTMEIGDSFSIDLVKEPTGYNCLNVAMSKEHKLTDKRYTMRSEKATKTVRLWRVS